MEPWQLAVTLFGGLFLYCLVLPALGGVLMFRGLRRAGIDNAPANLCVKVAFASTYASFFSVLLLGRYVLPDSSPIEGRLIWFATMLSLQLVIVVVLMRNYTPKALAIEIGVFLLVNLAVFAITLLWNPIRSAPTPEGPNGPKVSAAARL